MVARSYTISTETPIERSENRLIRPGSVRNYTRVSPTTDTPRARTERIPAHAARPWSPEERMLRSPGLSTS